MFGFGNKEEKKESCCGMVLDRDNLDKVKQTMAAGGIKVLGGGCAKCHELEANTKAALEALGSSAAVELITDFAVIAAYGVMSTPALVIDNRVVSCGRVLKTPEIVEILQNKLK